MEEYTSALEQFKQLANQAPCGIGLYKIETGLSAFLNDAYYDMVGYTREAYEKLGKEQFEQKLKQQLILKNMTVQKCAADFAKDDTVENCEYQVLRPDGRALWVNLRAFSVVFEHQKYALAFFTDMTKEKETTIYLRMIAENVTSSISLFRLTNQKESLIYANQSFYQMFGVSPEVYQKNVDLMNRSCVSESDYCRIQKVVQEAIAGENAGTIEHQFHRPNGEILWLDRRYVAIREEQADTYLLISVVTDITKRKNAELQAALEQHRYQLVVDELKAAVFEWDFQTGNFYSSAAYQNYAMSKINTEDIRKNRGPLDVIHPDDTAVIQQFFQESEGNNPKSEVVLRLKMMDGSFRWSRMIGLYYKDENGCPTRTIGVIIDINDEREKSIMLDSLLNEIPGGVALFKVTNKMECLYYSDGFAQISGRTRVEIDELIRQKILLENVIAPSDYQRFVREAGALTAKGLPVNLTFRYTIKDVGIGWLHMSANKMREEDGYPVYYCIFTNPSDETTQYRNIVEDSANGAFIAERSTRRILYVNDALCRICGFSLDKDILDHNLSEVLPEEDFILRQEQLDTLQDNEYIEFHIVRNGNQYLGIRTKALLWNDVEAYILYVTDETNEHNHQLQLQELVDRVPAGIGIFDVIDGVVHERYMNEGYYHLVKEEREVREKRTNHSFVNGMHPEDRVNVQQAVKALLADTDQVDFNYRALTSTGDAIWIRMVANVAERTENRLTVFCSFSDMNEIVRTQERLRESSDVLEAAINSADMTVWNYDPLLHRIEQTAASIQQHGFDPIIENVPESLIANGYVHPDSVDAYRSLFASVLQEKKVVLGDFYVRTKTCDSYWWERVILTPICDVSGELVKIIGTSTNVTERKEKEKRYLRQLDSMSEIDDENLIAKGRHNLTTNQTLFYFGKREGALEMTEGDPFEHAVEMLAASAIQQSKKEEIRKTMARQELLSNFAADKAEGSIEYKRQMPNGEMIWVILRYSLFEEPLTNDIIIFVYSYDITERVVDSQIVSKLSSMEYEALGLLDVKTHQYVLRDILTHIEGPTIIGKGDFDERIQTRLPAILLPSERDTVMRQFQVENIIAQLAEKKVYYIPYFVRDDAQTIRRKKCQFCYLDDTESTILYCRSDITEIYQKEQEQLHQTEEALELAREASKAKSAFLSQMSHDIRTPMNTIINLTRLVKEELDNREAALADLQKIETSNQFLLSLVNDILDMSRIEQKKIELHPEQYSYYEFLNYIRSTFEPLSQEKNIHFTVQKSGNDDDIIIDKVRFNQLCFNLISNAIKYTPSGGHIAFRMEHGEKKDGMIPCDIFISDDGIGMSKEFQAKMFEPFAQEGRAYKTVEGTGLGLSIVKEIVDLLDGTISVESKMDVGSVFHVHLNMTLADENSSIQKKETICLDVLKGKHILLAEDHPLNQEIARRLLANVGITIYIAPNGQVAVNEFAAHPEQYDAILMDMRMPVMDGLTAAKTIRQLEFAKAQEIPIIAMTANAFAEDRAESSAAGMNAHLAKPIDPNLMYETLARFFS